MLRSLIAAGVRNPVFANLLMLFFLVAGWFSSQHMVREAFPEFSLDHIAIEVVYPGASTEDVEQAICTPIEEALRGVSGVREISAAANEHFGTVWVGLLSNVRDSGAVLKEVKDRVDQITNWPKEAKKPIVRETSLRSEVINVAIYGDAPERTLKGIARDVSNDLETFPEISQIRLLGVREDEIHISVSEQALAAYDLSLDHIMGVVAKSSLNVPAGSIRTSDEEVTVRVTGQRYRAQDYEDLVVLNQGNATVRLGDLATVRETFEDTAVHGRFNGAPAVLVAIYKTPEEDTTKIAEVVRKYVAEKNAALPERLKMSVWGDSSVDVENRIGQLVSSGLQGLVILFLTIWVFLEFKLAFWVAAGIPISFAGSLLAMDYFGQTINTMSLFALIMVSGIIVDDSIVIAEMFHARRRAGDPPKLAAIEGTSRIALPVMGATLTTMIAFIPLLYVSGVMGRFVYVIPIAVLGAMVASTIEGFLIQPAHMAHGDPSTGHVAKAPNRFRVFVDGCVETVITRGYRRVSDWAITHRGITVSIALAVLMGGVGVFVSGRMPFVLFPKEDGTILRARVRFPEGTPASVAQKTIERLETAARALNSDPDVKPETPGDLVRQVSSVSGEFADFLPVRGNNLCEVRVELMPPGDRRVRDDRIIEAWRKHVGTIPDATEFRITQQQLGPTDRPIEIRLLGHDLDVLADASVQLQSRLRQFDGVLDVHDDLIPGKRQIRVDLKPAALAHGLTLEDVARQLREGFYGGEAVKLYRGNDQLTVRIRYPEEERRSIVDLENLRIKTPRGDEVPFLEVATVDWGRGYAMVMHQDGRRRVRVLADIDERFANAEQIVKTLQAGVLDEVVRAYPDVTYTFGGDRARADESFGSLGRGFLLALIANFAILVAVMRSFAKPFIVIAALPFGFLGVLFGHLLFGYDLTMMSLFGLVGVAGIAGDEAIVLFDFISHSVREEGKSVEQAVRESGPSRFRPIVLTAITDLAGMLPLLLNKSGATQSVQPMAISLSFGLMMSTVMSLLVMPSLFLVINDARRSIHWLRFGGTFPTREAVELDPAEPVAALV